MKRFELQTPDNTDAGENVVTSLFFELIDCLIRAIRKLWTHISSLLGLPNMCLHNQQAPIYLLA
ncbi:hypothetical protein AJ87_04870 [Rhizobium yanglingense]|nr:hypothetical protein AJ87_04870 [Rhizobium yanglingense]